MSELDDLTKKVLDNQRVQGLIIINTLGIPIRSTFENRVTVQYAALIHGLMDKAYNVCRNINVGNDLECFRIRTMQNEIIVTPVRDYMMITVQRMGDAQDESQKDDAQKETKKAEEVTAEE